MSMTLLARYRMELDGGRTFHLYVRQRDNELTYELVDHQLARAPFIFDVGPPPCFASEDKAENLGAVVAWLESNGFTETDAFVMRMGTPRLVARRDPAVPPPAFAPIPDIMAQDAPQPPQRARGGRPRKVVG